MQLVIQKDGDNTHWFEPFVNHIVDIKETSDKIIIKLLFDKNEIQFNEFKEIKKFGVDQLSIDTPVRELFIDFIPHIEHTGEVYITLTFDKKKNKQLLLKDTPNENNLHRTSN